MKPSLVRTVFAEAVFTRLARLRDRNPQPKSPWGHDWETFLDEASLPTAEEAKEAHRVASELAADGLLNLKWRRDGERIHRFTVPLESERNWFCAFGRIHPADVPDERADLKAFDWVNKLQFVVNSRINVIREDLLKLNSFLCDKPETKPIVHIKERSLQIFGDEKRLDALQSSALFRSDRLDLRTHLRCEIIGVPLAWKRGPVDASDQPIVVIENAATWYSYREWNEQSKLFSAVVYGDGNRFIEGVRYLADIFTELGGSRRVLYFGDLDPQGLVIPQEASLRAQAVGLPVAEPHLWSYRQLLILGAGRTKPHEYAPPDPTLCDWLQELAEPARQLFDAGHRLAQEHVGWEFLHQCQQENLENTSLLNYNSPTK